MEKNPKLETTPLRRDLGLTTSELSWRDAWPPTPPANSATCGTKDRTFPVANNTIRATPPLSPRNVVSVAEPNIDASDVVDKKNTDPICPLEVGHASLG